MNNLFSIILFVYCNAVLQLLKHKTFVLLNDNIQWICGLTWIIRIDRIVQWLFHFWFHVTYFAFCHTYDVAAVSYWYCGFSLLLPLQISIYCLCCDFIISRVLYIQSSRSRTCSMQDWCLQQSSCNPCGNRRFRWTQSTK